MSRFIFSPFVSDYLDKLKVIFCVHGVISPFLAHLDLSAIYMELGREEEARAHAAEVLKINPKFSLESLRKRSLFKDPAHSERFLSAMSKAGLPE
jgi:hypothetical protein